ncbi:uncharacterized protein LOC118645552 isoform X3 [Monomorium pharaonis]|uniref:uncharacterized protein LOC118645552 isoform X3 n=1 Tax=Monomorium pharaonis TaxID=307658 RepID=UPI00174793D1|nr:uncharacterized protein LOC118645552 isoform X3 [Monomorium pharaonis]
MYYVIFWDEYCQIIPHCWLNISDNTFQHPPSTCNMTKAIKKKINPGNDWKTSSYRTLLGPYDTYDKAREVEKSCTNISSSDDVQLAALNNLEQILPSKRQIIKKKFYDDTDDNKIKHPSKKYKRIPTPPHNYKEQNESDVSSKNGSPITNLETKTKNLKRNEVYITRNVPSTSKVPPVLKEHPFSIQVYHNESEGEEEEGEGGEEVDVIYSSVPENSDNDGYVISTDDDINNATIFATLISLQKKIDSLSEDFKRETAKNRAKVQEILAILRDKFPNGGNEEISHGLMPEFPLVTIEEYVQFNDMLKNDEQIRKCFDKRIKNIGGHTAQKMVSNILTTCITFEVGHKLSWTGAKNTLAIENSSFANIIIGVVSRTRAKGSTEYTIAEIIKHIKNWLQHAGDKMRFFSTSR